MNIFALHNDPFAAAQMQCDKHVVKMVLESAQMLSAVHHKYNTKQAQSGVLYRMTHKNHPCTVWAGMNTANYRWLYYHFKALASEYTYRYNKQHLSFTKLQSLLDHQPPDMPIVESITPFALAMPDQYKFFDTPVECYRAYYKHEKADILRYTRRPMPEWLN